ncbi:unnamed protein product [Ectocarpus sp. 12 AP-2014]
MASSATHKLTAFLQNPVVRVVQATSILHCINEYAFGITACAGPSMIPTFNQSGDVLFADMFSANTGRLDRGDVVIAIPPQNPRLRVCKRIIGLPGETVIVRSRSWFNDRPEFVPQGHVWLEGDNLSNSSDSRTYGPIPLAMVRGRVFFKAWPPSEIGRVARRVPETASTVLPRETADDSSVSSGGLESDAPVRFVATEAVVDERGRGGQGETRR